MAATHRLLAQEEQVVARLHHQGRPRLGHIQQAVLRLQQVDKVGAQKQRVERAVELLLPCAPKRSMSTQIRSSTLQH